MQVLAPRPPRQAHILWLIDWSIWALFMLDYVVRLYLAPDRWHWFWHHLIDFAIVTLPLIRPLRLLRLVVLIEMLQKAVGDAFRGRIVVYTASGVVLLIYSSSLAVFDKERYLHGATINSFGKALWWSICTATTVGYGDVYPVTNTGRVIAVLLMIGGIRLVVSSQPPWRRGSSSASRKRSPESGGDRGAYRDRCAMRSGHWGNS